MPKFTDSYLRAWYLGLVPDQVIYENIPSTPHELYKIVFDLAATCNMSCGYCFANEGKYKVGRAALLSVPNATRIMDNLTSAFDVIHNVKFFGGEPTLNIEAMEYICDRFRIEFSKESLSEVPSYSIVTNGSFLSDRVLAFLKNNAVYTVVSFDSIKEIMDFTRPLKGGGSSYDVVLGNILKMQAAGVNLGTLESVYSVEHYQRGISMVEAQKELEKIFPGYFQNITVHPLDEGSLRDKYGAEEIAKYSNSIFKQSRELFDHIYRKVEDKIKLARFFNSPKQSESLCDVGDSIITIKADGAVYPCYVFSDRQEYRFGQATDQEFFEIFDSERSRGHMRAANRFNHNACKTCEISDVCSHCLSGMTDSGVPNLPDVSCAYLHGHVESILGRLHEMASRPKSTEFATE